MKNFRNFKRDDFFVHSNLCCRFSWGIKISIRILRRYSHRIRLRNRRWKKPLNSRRKKCHFWLHSYSAFTKQGLKRNFIFCFGLFEKLSSGTFFTARLPKTFSQKYKNVLNSTTLNKNFWLSFNSQIETLRILILLTFS